MRDVLPNIDQLEPVVGLDQFPSEEERGVDMGLLWLARRVWCSIRGHKHFIPRRDATKIWLECLTCGKITRGWDVPKKETK